MRGLISQMVLSGAFSLVLVTASRAQTPPPDFFADHDDLEFIVYTDLSVLLADTSLESPDRPGEVGYMEQDGTAVWLPVKIETRGLYRLIQGVCEFPPLRLDFRARHLRGTLFDGQNTIKMVTHCQSDPEFQKHVILEYLAYRVYELLTPKSIRARLVKVTYGDVSETYEPITRYAVLLEDIDDVAIRNGMVEVDIDGFHAMLADEFEMGVHDVFEFLIGNTDWSTLVSQNVKFLQDVEGNTTVVPFDFDWSGVVNVPYSYPAPDLPIANVRERYYMGVCRLTDHLTPVFEYFVEKKDEIYDLFRNEPALGQEPREQALAYFDEFYEIITDEELAKQHIRDACKM